MAYSQPGVYITEGPFSTTTPVGPTVTPTAFLGTVARGPEVPTRIDSWNQYKTSYGDLTNSSDLGYAVYHFFANGGRTAYVTRVTASAAVKAKSAGVAGSINGSAVNPAAGGLFEFRAKSKGTWANWVAAGASSAEKGLRVYLLTGARDGTLSGGQPLTFNIYVYFKGEEVERWTEVSLDPDSPQYAPTIVNNYSNYVDLVFGSSLGVNPALTAGTTYAITGTTTSVSTTVSYKIGDATSGSDTDGTDGTVADSDWQTALNNLDLVTGSMLINLVGQTTATLVNMATTYAEARGNGFVIIDPSPAQTNTAGITGLTNTYNKTSFGAVYYPMLKMPDPARSGAATLRDTYPGGALAGLFARVEQERTVAKAPAGYAYELRNVYGLGTTFTETQIGLLYNDHVNTLKNIPGGGVISNGARTLKRTDITKYVPVRRAINYIKENVENIANFSVFEPNGERVWTDINTRISRFLSDFWGAGGLKGRNATEAFYIICDASNNPQYAVENGELHVEVGVALQSPAEFIIINVTQFAGGASTAAEAV
jgi:phage tail sheath protein FI